MPIYDYRCRHCGLLEEARSPMDCREVACRYCGGASCRLFSPNPNILIPTAFKSVTQGFNSGSRGEDSAPYSSNNSVHAPKRDTFTEAFDANYKKAGGIG